MSGVTTDLFIPRNASKDDLVRLYKEQGLFNAQLCQRWKEETLRRKLAEAGFVEETAEPALEPIPEPEPISEPVAEEPADEPEPQPEPQTQEEIEHRLVHSVARKVPLGDRTPMCQGLALVPGGNFLGSAEATFTADKGARWVSLHYLPPGHFRDPVRLRDRYLASVRRTTHRYGMPELSPQGVTAQYDYSLAPAASPAGEELPLDDRQLLRVCNALGWAMLSTAFRCRKVWAPYKEAFLAFLEAKGGVELTCRAKMRGFVQLFTDREKREPDKEEKLANVLVFGGDRTWSGATLRDRDWFPVPHLSFPSTIRDVLFDRVTLQELQTGVTRSLPDALVVHLADDLAAHGQGVPFRVPFAGRYDSVEPVRKGGRLWYTHWFYTPGGWRHLRSSRKLELLAEPGADLDVGQLVGYEPVSVPAGFAKFHPGRKARELRRGLRREELADLAEDWFNRQLWEVVSGRIHVASHLCAAAAHLANPAGLVWRVNQCRRFWDDASDAYVFPTHTEYPLFEYRQDVQTPTCELRVDLTPADERLWRQSCRWFGLPANKAKKARHAVDRDTAKEYLAFHLDQIKAEERERLEKLERARLLAAQKAAQAQEGSGAEE